MLKSCTFGIAALAALCSCGGNNAGKAVTPKNDATFAGTAGAETIKSGATCTDVGNESSPYIVDWKTGERTDLAATMAHGVAFVHYDCNGFKLLQDCRLKNAHTPVPGEPPVYAFIGVTKKEDLMSIKSLDEAKVNLPAYGATIGAGISAGTTVDIGMITIGQAAEADVSISRDELGDGCEGATHFVRSAQVGAYVMAKGATGQVKAAAQMFNIGAAAGSSNAESSSNKDGDATACQSADPNAPAPPGQCSAVMKVRLLAIKEGSKPTEGAKDGTGEKAAPPKNPAPPQKAAKAMDSSLDPNETVCARGLVAVNGLCVAATANQAHECKPRDGADCQKQCDAGDMPSCAKLGYLYTEGPTNLGPSGVRYDENKGVALFKKACDAGVQAGCNGLGEQYDIGEGVPQDQVKAVALFQTACASGYADACGNLAMAYQYGTGGLTKDVSKAVSLYSRACVAGSSDSCNSVGDLFEKGKLVKKNLPLAIAFWDRACLSGARENCDDLGDRFSSGDGAPAVDKARAAYYYLQGCDERSSGSCYSLGQALEKGDGIAADKTKAMAMYARACKLYKGSPACKKVAP